MRNKGEEHFVFTVMTLHTHRSATTLKPLTGEVNNIDHLITMAPVKQ